MHKKINENLLRAYGEMVPKDLFDRIEQNIVPQERTVTMKKNMKLSSLRRFVAGAAAALILIAGGIFGGIYYANHLAVDTLVDIDVNPGIELSVNKQEQVLKAKAINEDAVAILDGMDLQNTDLQVAVNAIIGSMVQKGYLGKDAGGILISVQNEDPARAKIMQQKINTQVHTSLQHYQTNTSILNQTIPPQTNAADFAKEHQISLGKAVFILNLAEKDSSLKPEELAKMSLLEITAIIKKNGLDISDIVDYDADDSILENITDEIEDTNEDAGENPADNPQTAQKPQETQKPATQQPTAPSYIGIEKAKSIALSHAGVQAADARFEKAELERDDGVAHYELEFKSGNTEYEYEIHAESGKILKSEKDREAENKPATQKPASAPQAAAPADIGIEKAKSIALAHAGVQAADARFEKSELDRDDGIFKYEIEFHVNNTEYSYDIHATSGKILDFEKDIDD